VERELFHRWIEGYERAWRAPGTEALADLVTPDAAYRTTPFERPFEGLEVIAAFWERERASADEEFEMSWELVAVEGETGVARIEVEYADPPQRYRDLWVIRLAGDGLCREFEEWPFWPPGSDGTFVSGPDRD
jgi:ketosteroid isomerase-like protein